MRTADVLRLPAWQRRAATIVLPAVLLAGLALVRYLGAGGRMAAMGFGYSAPVTIGEEFHVGVPLRARSGEIEVVKVRPVGVSGPVHVDLRLVLETASVQLGSSRGPLDSSIVVLPLPTSGLKVTSAGGADYSVDIRLVPTGIGRAEVAAFDVTYRAGPLRTRTARLNAGICLDVFADDWRGHIAEANGCRGRNPRLRG